MPKILHLFPDTNVFIQCRPLDQLDWNALGDFEEIHLIVSRPVQSEIDAHKNRGGERIARRARKASGTLREVILGAEGFRVVRGASPIVKLFVRTELQWSRLPKGLLDYNEPDDQLVGIVHAYAKGDRAADARLLTHDVGPMASARRVGVAIVPVPDDWLLPPETSEADKRIRSLEADVMRLKSHEPSFLIECIDADGREAAQLDLELRRYNPLTEEEVSTLLERVRSRFPFAQEYGNRERAERPLAALGGSFMETFTPASEAEIEDYRKRYTQWIEACASQFRRLHQREESRWGPLTFEFVAKNDGTRPANHALIVLSANGAFKIMAPPPRQEEDDNETQAIPAPLPSAPRPPTGRSVTKINSPLPTFPGIDLLRDFQQSAGMRMPPAPSIPEHLLHPRLPRPRDPNDFYYKPNRPQLPVTEFSFECEQWRHGVGPESFAGMFYVPESDDEVISGALECRIHAENLSDPASKLIPVRIRITHATVLHLAERLVDELL